MKKLAISLAGVLVVSVFFLAITAMVAMKEVGFMDKMTWGETQTISVNFYDQTNEKYKGKSKISMHFYSGTTFFGDIATIQLDLTEYGDFSGNFASVD